MNRTSSAPLPSVPDVDRRARLRRALLAAILLVLVQAGVGIAVNLFVSVPRHHPGANPSNYFAGSYTSVTWALGHATPVLAAHAGLGLLLAVAAVAAAVRALRAALRAAAAWTVLGGLLVMGAGFNGSSFLDFGHDVSSLLMALLAFGAAGAYAVALSLTARPAPTATA